MKITKKKFIEKEYILEVTEDELLELNNGLVCADNESQTMDGKVFNHLCSEFDKYIKYGRMKE